MNRIYIVFFLLCLPVLDCNASAPVKIGYGEWSEKINIEKENSEKSVNIMLFQKKFTIDGSSTRVDLQEIGSAKATYNPNVRFGYIDEVYITDNPTKRRGCGSHLFKQVIAELYTHFICTEINFFAYAFTNPKSEEAHERLKKFYIKLGAVVDTKYLTMQGTNMIYPMHLAAALAGLMPSLEPMLLDESLQNDPVTTIIQYVGPVNSYEPEVVIPTSAHQITKPFPKLSIIIDDGRTIA